MVNDDLWMRDMGPVLVIPLTISSLAEGGGGIHCAPSSSRRHRISRAPGPPGGRLAGGETAPLSL
jgi:hypothetical protein